MQNIKQKTLFSILAWLAVAALYAPIFYQLYHMRWNAIDYTHAYFILPVSIWFVWRKRALIKELTVGKGSQKSALGLAIILVALLMFVFGWKQDYLMISTLSLIPLLFGIILFVYGLPMARILSFPILYLLLLVPPPLGVLDSITLPMRYLVSVATEGVLKVFHYPILRDGLLLSINKHEIYVAQPCSGFRSFITMFALGLAYSYISKGTLKKKALLVVSIIPLALLGNLFRIASLCIVTYYLGESTGQKYYHDISGLIIFILLVLSLMGIDALLDRMGMKRE